MDPTPRAVSRAEVHVLIAYAGVMAWAGRGLARTAIFDYIESF